MTCWNTRTFLVSLTSFSPPLFCCCRGGGGLPCLLHEHDLVLNPCHFPCFSPALFSGVGISLQFLLLPFYFSLFRTMSLSGSDYGTRNQLYIRINDRQLVRLQLNLKADHLSWFSDSILQVPLQNFSSSPGPTTASWLPPSTLCRRSCQCCSQRSPRP